MMFGRRRRLQVGPTPPDRAQVDRALKTILSRRPGPTGRNNSGRDGIRGVRGGGVCGGRRFGCEDGGSEEGAAGCGGDCGLWGGVQAWEEGCGWRRLGRTRLVWRPPSISAWMAN
ncbi:hypothetical protein PHJA_002157900 [Phtheirospermum japonicum]|uniref:Uncharacterized protein n=1 Tax=Phtheirospermum japonicum TaxID=374723 RepID=A0A830CRC6_9LAMI|nr:hypothetical protein PHJA_002157900 [Phtheirospermum japonicum]